MEKIIEVEKKSKYGSDYDEEDGTDREESDDGYYFNCGEVFAAPGRYKEINKSTFYDLEGIITEM